MTTRPKNLLLIGNQCSPENWKSSLLIGSVLTWMLGVVVFGMAVAMMKNPIFDPLVMPYLHPLYHSLASAIATSILICCLAFSGCCGSACEAPKILKLYSAGLLLLFVLQVAVGSALLYYGHELFSVVQYVSIEVCRGHDFEPSSRRMGRQMTPNTRARVAKVLRDPKEDTNKAISRMLTEYRMDQVKIKCPPVKDLATPIGSLLIFCSLLYIYLIFCAISLMQYLRMKDIIDNMNYRKSNKNIDAVFTDDESHISDFAVQSPLTPGFGVVTAFEYPDVPRTLSAGVHKASSSVVYYTPASRHVLPDLTSNTYRSYNRNRKPTTSITPRPRPMSMSNAILSRGSTPVSTATSPPVLPISYSLPSPATVNPGTPMINTPAILIQEPTPETVAILDLE